MTLYQDPAPERKRALAYPAAHADGTTGAVAAAPDPSAPELIDPNGGGPAWCARAGELADWALGCVVVRTDGYLAYRRIPTAGAIVVAMTTIHAPLTREHLIRHFVGEEHKDRVAVHIVCPIAETCKVTVVDIDAHGPEDDPGANWSFARVVARRAMGRGVLTRVLDTNGLGGYHVWAFHPRPIPCAESHLFGKWLVHGWAEHGLRKEPESLPKSPGLTGKRFGQPIRLPGRHHTRSHWTAVWDGVTDDRNAGFLRGPAAVDAILETREHPVRVPASPLVPPDFSLPGRRFASPNFDRSVDPDDLDRDAALARQALGYLGQEYFEDYHRWLRVGMALRQLGDRGLALWHEWSAQSRRRYRPEVLDEKWRTFESAAESPLTPLGNRPHLISLGSLFAWARDKGWKAPEKESASTKRGPRRRWSFEVKL